MAVCRSLTGAHPADWSEHSDQHADSLWRISRVHVDGDQRRRDTAMVAEREGDGTRAVRLAGDQKRHDLATVFPSRRFPASPITRGYLGQNWAEGRSVTENLGALFIAQLSGTWSLAAGVFHSRADNPLSFADLYTETRFSAFGKNNTLRVQIQNVPNSSWWTNVYTPGLFQWPAPRTVFAYLTTDL
jgi:hypothetical protein